MAMSPAAPQGAPTGPAAPKEGGAANLVTDINSNLMKLMEMVQSTPAVSPEEKQQLGSIITEYQAFVQGLGEAPGAKKPQAAPQAPSSVPVEAGANPNARPL